MKTNFLIAFFAGWFLLFSTCLMGQDSLDEQEVDDYLDLSLEQLLSIQVVSASKVKQEQSDAPNIITGMPMESARKFGWLTTNEVLNYQPGYFLSHDYERRTLGFRGMFEGWNNNHMLMLVDGIPFNDNLYGTAYTWDNTPLNFVKSIENIRGPGGALYGSNAMNGVVTLNTLNVDDLGELGSARVQLGTPNYRYFDIVTGTQNDNVGIVVSFSHSATEGNEYKSYDASGRVDNSGNPLRLETNDSRENTYFFTKIYGKGNLEGLTFQYHEQHWDFETGHGWLFVIPDRPENMRENRRIAALKYAPQSDRALNYELTTRYQVHNIDWKMRYFNDGALENYYPDGVSEYLNTKAKDLFFRAQIDYNQKDHLVFAGIESTTFLYDGDKAHYANIDMNTWADPTGETHFELNPWLEFIQNNPVWNVAGFVQYISPKFFDKIQLTASGRFDQMFFNYNNLNEAGSPQEFKSFQMFTPRLAAVVSPTETFTIKAIFGQAFRTPTPTEMFGYNTYSLASNIDQLEPEIVTNFDLGAIWEPTSGVKLGLNSFWVNFENQIAYSVANANLSTNIYSLETVGVEAEAQYAKQNFSGFANFTYAQRISEEIQDETISDSQDEITWAPATLFKMGARYKFNNFKFSALAYHHGKMNRRETDIFEGMGNYRPAEYVDGWFVADLKVAYKISAKTEIGLLAKNVLNAERYFIKNNAYLFDYRMEGRHIIGELVVNF
ncbi:MAG: TonB-dependent receptor plug domain-containing protein [Bacteroidales bacterium]